MEHFPVAIVGGGVVGLAAAVALARFDIRTVVLERAESPSDHPRAHVVNPRSMEIFRLWGVDQAVCAAALSDEATGNFTWMTSLAGETLGEIRYSANHERVVATRRSATLTPEASCAQDIVERILYERLRELQGDPVRFGAEVTNVDQVGDGVRLAVGGTPDSVAARYVIAADGAGSPTRERLGIGMDGPNELARFLALYLHADMRELVGHRPSVLYWIVNSAVQGVFISMDGGSRFTFHTRIDPGDADFEHFTPERCRALLQAAIGRDDIEPEIRQIGRWIMSGQVAERYRAGDVFLAGDAAHRFPPTGGFGMNTGIQDVHNLAWKLAAVLEGWAPDALLDTYDTERRPVADVNRSRSVANFDRLEALACWSADPDPIIRRLESDGKTAVEERRRFREEVARQRDHFDKFDQELGFVYRSGALVPEGTDDDAPPADYLPGANPGARAPLVMLDLPGGGNVASTDLFERTFVLIAAGDRRWREAAAAVQATGVPIRCLVVGEDLLDPGGDWARSYGVRPGGAVVVRPDGHVAFRARSAPHDITETLTDAFRRILQEAAA